MEPHESWYIWRKSQKLIPPRTGELERIVIFSVYFLLFILTFTVIAYQFIR